MISIPIVKDIKEFNSSDYKKKMSDKGYFLLNFSSEIDILELVKKIGVPHDHNGTGKYVWDVRPIKSEKKLARSHTVDYFTFHTDCSFESPPPNYVGLYVVQEDQMGGGVSKLLCVEKVLEKLDPKELLILRELFPVNVPEEFQKNRKMENCVPILFGEKQIAFREECIKKEKLSVEQSRTVSKLKSAISTTNESLSMILPKGTLLVFDNTRFLHARTKILDEKRHLKRVRFN